jgi:hypothetical protein
MISASATSEIRVLRSIVLCARLSIDEIEVAPANLRDRHMENDSSASLQVCLDRSF